MVVVDLRDACMVRCRQRGHYHVNNDCCLCLEERSMPCPARRAEHVDKRCHACAERLVTSVVPEEEDLPWVCYIWPCSARLKCFMTEAASPFLCARRKPCCSTWRSRGGCIPAANWRRCCGLTVSPRSRGRPCATPLRCCVTCSPRLPLL